MPNDPLGDIEVDGNATYGTIVRKEGRVGTTYCSVTTNGPEGGDMSENCKVVIDTDGHLMVKLVDQELRQSPNLRKVSDGELFTVYGTRQELEEACEAILEKSKLFPGGLGEDGLGVLNIVEA